MKSEELMIGDWYIWEAEGKKYYYQVTKETFASPEYDISNFQPVPLTVEILEKNGFKQMLSSKHEYSIEDNNYNYLRVRNYCDSRFEIGNASDEEGELLAFADIQFVHQLQHALKLFGIEKEITL